MRVQRFGQPPPLDTLRLRLHLLLEELGGVARTVPLLERWPLYVFVSSAMVCLAASVVYHLFGTANEQWNGTLGRWDFGGIVGLSNLAPPPASSSLLPGMEGWICSPSTDHCCLPSNGVVALAACNRGL